jgi:hypothetical protein
LPDTAASFNNCLSRTQYSAGSRNARIFERNEIPENSGSVSAAREASPADLPDLSRP